MSEPARKPETDGDLKSIAEVADALGVTQRTLRFYEDKGLIQPTRVGSMRVYSKREMGRMSLILRGKKLGFSIREISEFLELYDGDRNHARQTRTLLDRVRQRLADLKNQRDAIDETIGELAKIEDEAQAHLQRITRRA